jgi:dTDP-glucose 4,6-dehydratase
VTGGAGFIGANLVHYWLDRYPDDRIVVLDALTYAGHLASLQPALSDPRLTFVHGDIATPGLAEGLLREHGLTTVVHLAAESHVDRSIVAPEAFLHTNVIGTHVLLQAALKVWSEPGGPGIGARFHHVSTDEVYGSLGPDDPPATEESRYAPSSPYAASKAASDHLVRAYHRTYGLPVSLSHCSNNYGPYQFPEKLIPLILVRALEGKPLPVYGDGLNRRDWLHVGDHCRGLDRILSRGRVGETYSLGAGNEGTNISLVRLFCRLLDRAFQEDPALVRRFPKAPAASGRSAESLVAFVGDRPSHDRRYAMNTVKAQRELGWSATEPFEEGLRQVLAWYLGHEAWWRGIMDGRYHEWIQNHYGGNVSF